MKQETLTLRIDEERMAALRLYMGQKELTVESAMEQALESLYLKYVPANVRDFISLRSNQRQTEERRQRPRHPQPSDVPEHPEGHSQA